MVELVPQIVMDDRRSTGPSFRPSTTPGTSIVREYAP